MCVFVLPGATKTLYIESSALFSSFTWWQGVWLLMVLSGLVFRVREVQDINAQPLDAWAGFRIAVEGIVAVILISRLVSGRTPWLRTLFLGLLAIMTAFVVIDLVSTSWSVKPLWTFYKSTEYLVDLSVVAALITTLRSTEELEKFANWTWTLIGCLLVTSWVGAIIDPADALEKGYTLGPLQARLTGLIPSSVRPMPLANSVQSSESWRCIVCWTIRTNDSPAAGMLFLFAASMVTLVFSQTRSAIGAYVFAVVSFSSLLGG